MLRWGILSTAKIAREQLIPAIQLANNATVSAIASRDGEKAGALAQRFSIPKSFGNYEELLASPEVDAVYIPLPSSQHVEWSIKAADAGKHVLSEKPVAMHADEINSLIEARDRNNVLISEAFMVTYHPQWHKVKELVSSGAIGQLKLVQGAFSYFNMDPENMRNVPDLGGGALPDIGVYPVVTTRFVTGTEPNSVSSSVERDPNFGTDTFSSCRLDFGSFELSMYVSTQMALRQSMVFHGDKGWIELSAPFNAGLYDADVVTFHNSGRSETKSYRFAGVNQYQLQIEQISAALLKGSYMEDNNLFSLEQSKLNQHVIDAIFRAGESGQWEKVQG